MLQACLMCFPIRYLPWFGKRKNTVCSNSESALSHEIRTTNAKEHYLLIYGKGGKYYRMEVVSKKGWANCNLNEEEEIHFTCRVSVTERMLILLIPLKS
jgi:hypothetical protein